MKDKLNEGRLDYTAISDNELDDEILRASLILSGAKDKVCNIKLRLSHNAHTRSREYIEAKKKQRNAGGWHQRLLTERGKRTRERKLKVASNTLCNCFVEASKMHLSKHEYDKIMVDAKSIQSERVIK